MDYPNVPREGKAGQNRNPTSRRRAKRIRRRNSKVYVSSATKKPHVSCEEVLEITDEDAYRKGFDENQGIHIVLGAQYIRSSNKADTVHWIVYVIFLAILWLCLIRTALLLLDDLQLLFETVHWCVIASVSMIYPHLPPKYNYDRIFTCLGKGIHTYKTLDEETAHQVEEMRARRRKETTFLSKGFSASLLGTLFGFLVLMPLMSIISGNGIVTGVPAAVWIPVKVSDGHMIVTRILLLLFEGYVSFTVVNMVIGQRTTEICFGHTLYYEFQILALTFERFEQRAKLVNTTAARSPVASNSGSNGLEECALVCLRESIQHHNVLLTIVKDYVQIFNNQELLTLMSSTMTICMSSLAIVSDIPLAAKLVAFVFVGAEMVNVFVVCYLGQVLLNAHEIIQDGVYSSSWPSYSRPVRQYVLIILTRLQKQLKIAAAGMVQVNLDTFTQVVKTAFSYFSLLQALKE